MEVNLWSQVNTKKGGATTKEIYLRVKIKEALEADLKKGESAKRWSPGSWSQERGVSKREETLEVDFVLKNETLEVDLMRRGGSKKSKTLEVKIVLKMKPWKLISREGEAAKRWNPGS